MSADPIDDVSIPNPLAYYFFLSTLPESYLRGDLWTIDYIGGCYGVTGSMSVEPIDDVSISK